MLARGGRIFPKFRGFPHGEPRSRGDPLLFSSPPPASCCGRRAGCAHWNRPARLGAPTGSKGQRSWAERSHLARHTRASNWPALSEAATMPRFVLETNLPEAEACDELLADEQGLADLAATVACALI